MKQQITNADICELAHTLAERECKQRKIILDKMIKEKGKVIEVAYSAKAQRIFDYYYDQITNILGL